MRDLKFYPRDLAENRRLVLFAERVVGELSRDQRQVLEFAVDQFEQAMSMGERDAFEESRRDLLVALSSLGYPYAETPAEGGHEFG